VSGVWVRCPNCDLEVKVELNAVVVDGNIGMDPDFSLLADHARNCAEVNG